MQMVIGTPGVAPAATLSALARARAVLADCTARHEAEKAGREMARNETRHEHEWGWEGRKVGRCLSEYSCKTCSAVQVVDSSD